MKRIITVFGVSILLLLFSGNLIAQQKGESNYYQPRTSGNDNAYGISGALEYYKLIRGIPEASDIVNAHKAANLLPKSKSMTWTEIGPDNMAGRTRAILIDKNDNNVLYVGGVSGGLWQSITGGTSWELITPLAENYAVSCITQDVNGIIYFGTGEGFAGGSGTAAGSTGFIGGGVFKSTDASGSNFSVLTSTVPSGSNVKWKYVYEIAAQGTRIYACTDGGLQMSSDGGTTWSNPVLYPNNSPYTFVSHDVEIGSDGSVYAVVGKKIFYSPDGNTGTFVDRSLPNVNANALARVEIAVAPSDPHCIYASAVKTTGALHNVYRSLDAGETWTIIGPGGSANFNVFGLNNQGFWDNIIKVFPNDKNHILLGGVDLWDWREGSTWTQKSLYYLPSSSLYYLHSGHHEIVFHPTNPNMFYHGSDGGISKSIDGGNTFSTLNRKLSTVQFYNLNCNMFDQVMGGTQDNGTIVIPGNLTTTGTCFDYLGGTGGWSAMSYINPDVIVGTSYYGDLYRSNEFGKSPKGFYSGAMNVPSDLSPDWAGFITPIYLDEQINDLNSPDSIYFHADTTYPAGATVLAHSKKNNNFPFQYTLQNSINEGDSVLIQDRVQARFYVGLNGAVWMTKGLHDFSGAPDWYKVASINGSAQCMAGSKDGNFLFVGTDNGNLYRISNLCAVKDSITGYNSSPYCVVECTRIANTGGVITSVAVNPNDPTKVLYTLGGYGRTNYVFYSSNALDSMPAFANKTGNLPLNPVYASTFEMGNNNMVILGTELGIFTTSNITAGSVQWAENNESIGRVPVYSLVQQTKNFPGTNNYGVIYAGTHGRGAFKSMTYLKLEDNQVLEANTNVNIYPNPAIDVVKFEFNSLNNCNGVVNIYSIDGKLALSKQVKVKNGDNTIDIDVTSLVNGNYLVEIKFKETSLTGKLIKK